MSLLAVSSGDIAGGTSVAAPEGVDFDGVNDYLSRSSDLVGNVNSKTFTFSCWFYFCRYSLSRIKYYTKSCCAGFIFLNNHYKYLYSNKR